MQSINLFLKVLDDYEEPLVNVILIKPSYCFYTLFVVMIDNDGIL